MSGNGPTKLDDAVIQDITFLYPTRLAELVHKTQVSVPASPSTFDESLELDDILPVDVKPQTQERMESSLAAANKTLDYEAIVRDFIIERAGYLVESSEAFSEDYRLKFERIILEENEIFEKLFIAIKAQVDSITAKELLKPTQERKPKSQIVKEAREKALEVLGAEYFAKLGQYYGKDNKFYFDENETAKGLSNHFLTSLFSNPELAEKILEAQKDKTKGQLQGKKAQLVALLPTAYNGTVEELSLVNEDFDLFLASPSIIDIAQGKTSLCKTKSRAEKLQSLLHELKDGKFDEMTNAFANLSLNGEKSKTADQFIESMLIEFRPFLIKHHFNFELLANINPVEKMFVIKKHVLKYINDIEVPAIKVKAIALDDEIKIKQEALKARKEEITTEYLAENYEAKTLTVLSKELKAGMKVVTDAIANKCEHDVKMQGLNGNIVSLQGQKNALENEVKDLRNKLSDHKYEFVNKYYPQIIPVANGLKKAYSDLLELDQDNKRFEKEGGTYSCLTFLPIKIAGNTPQHDRYECLVAMSGAQVENSDSVNAHQLLSKLSSDLEAFQGFQFRYVGPGSSSLDLLLKQIGKGLSGMAEPLSHLRKDPLPVFEKACAEKRLINELVTLYAEHGQNIQVLGCDNIALPTYLESTVEKQAERKAKEEAAEKAKAQAAKAAATKSSKKEKVKKESESDKKESTSPLFTIEASLPGRKVKLEGQHITCCSSCQAQKPAVFTVLFDSMKRGSHLSHRQSTCFAKTHVPTSIKTTHCSEEVAKPVELTQKVGLKISC